MASSRAPAPAALHIEKHRSPSTSSATSPDYFTETTPLAPPTHNRTSSSSSSDSSGSFSQGARKPSSPRNVYTHCGRHTDQYLFGGRGFTDMWKAITKKE